ncbi:MAG TPA: HAD family hydrolase [Coriobacteriia bacterium]|nr:HAD family hydrolase [Coriobacteriia bacterium]
MQGILFDLDGTLLDIDIGTFLDRYFAALARTIEPLTDGGDTLQHAMGALTVATHTMMQPHPGRTNEQVFTEAFLTLTGIDIQEHADVFARFYADEFPLLGDGYGPAPGARAAVETALGLGLKVAIATNPIFPREAVRHRIAWADLDDLPVDAVTTFETMHACKPLPEYFLQTASLIGVGAQGCMMVGDDAELDLPAAAVGMRTYYVGDRVGVSSDHAGDLVALARGLPEFVASW